MAEVTLSSDEQQVAKLVVLGFGTEEIARELKMKQRTVKQHFAPMFMKFEIKSGIKSVKLATALYRRQLCSTATANAQPPISKGA